MLGRNPRRHPFSTQTQPDSTVLRRSSRRQDRLGDAVRALPWVIALLLSASRGLAAYPQIKLNTDGTTQLQNEQQIVVNPTDPSNVVACWRDFRLGYRQVGVGYSLDGGYTWTDYLIGGELPWDSDPVLTAHHDGTFYLVVINYEDGGENQISVHRSTNKGITWDGPFTVVFSNGSTFEDKEWIAVDRTHGALDGNLYISWSRFYDVKIMCVRSTDRGESWSAPVQVSAGGEVGQWPVPLVMKNSSLLIAWSSYSVNAIKYDVSTNAGATWGTDRTLTTTGLAAGETINGNITVFPYPALASDETGGPRSGWVYCVYADRGVSANGVDIYCRRSTDFGVNWSARVRVNDDLPGLQRDQFHPWVACDEGGNLVAIWYDRRDDLLNQDWHIYLSRSTDGGATWSANDRITDVASSPDDALASSGDPMSAVASSPLANPTSVVALPLPNRTSVLASWPRLANGALMPDELVIDPLRSPRAGLIGEYSGVTVAAGVAHPIWTDTRNGNQDTFASVVGVTSAVHEFGPFAAALRLEALPNPARRGQVISFQAGGISLPPAGGSDTSLQLEVTDLVGRRILFRRLDADLAGSIYRWDGGDDTGRLLPAGVYFARLRGGDRWMAETRVTIVR